jgi:hypothetical protein
MNSSAVMLAEYPRPSSKASSERPFRKHTHALAKMPVIKPKRLLIFVRWAVGCARVAVNAGGEAIEARRNSLEGVQPHGRTCPVHMQPAFEFAIEFRIRKIGLERSEMFQHGVGTIRSRSLVSYFQQQES